MINQTRAEWQIEKDAEHLRNGAWGFDPAMPWRVAYWHERIGIMFFYGVMWGVVFPAMLLGMLWVIGTMADGLARHKTEHDRCLKNATNGYEIRQCN